MPKWRKATWALVIFNVLMLVWLVTGLNNVAELGPAASEAEEAGRAIGAGVGVTFLIILWFIGFIVLGLVWLMSRPKDNVLVYGPNGQQVMVSEKEAKKRVEKQGWQYNRSA